MTQGLFIGGRRPKTKKEIKERVAADPSRVYLEATSVMGNEFDGPVSEMPIGKKVAFVGPDPYTARNFYGTVERRADGRIVVS